MTTEELSLSKSFQHYCYDNARSSYELWYPMCTTFEEVWNEHYEKLYESCPSSDWREECLTRGLVEFSPYTKEALELKLAVMGY